MMKYRKEKCKIKDNSKNCQVWEYDLGRKNLSIARAVIDGRYPDEGNAMNKECDQIYFILSGVGQVLLGDKKYELKEKDALYFKKGTKYRVSGDKLEVLVINNPAWSQKQYEIS